MPIRAVLVAVLVLMLAPSADAVAQSGEGPEATRESRDDAESGGRPPGIVYPEIVEEEDRTDSRQRQAPAGEDDLEAAIGVMRRVAAFALDSLFLLVASALAGIGIAGLVTLVRARRSK